MAGVGVGVRSQARDLLRVTEYEKQATPLPKVLSSNHSETEAETGCVLKRKRFGNNAMVFQFNSPEFHTQAYVEGLNVCMHAYTKKGKTG